MPYRTGARQSLFATFRLFLYFIGHPFFLLLVSGVNLFLLLTYILGKIILTLFLLIRFSLSGVNFLLLEFSSTLRHLILQLSRSLLKLRPRPKIPLPQLRLPPLPRLRPRLKLRLKPLSFFPKFLLHLLSITTVLFTIFLFGIYLPFLKNLPAPNTLVTRHQPLTTKILARDGTLLYKIYQDQNRTLVPLSDIPDSLKFATIAIEDKDFYSHGGFSYRGIIRAIRRNVFDHKLQGGSTITQQLVKNALLSPEKTLVRKVREIVLSILVEIKFSKDQILEMYFNEVAYGGTTYGVEEAAQTYFGKSVKDLSLAEAAFLAGLPAAPTTYSPFGAHPELAKIRQAEVLRRLHQDGYITAEQAEAAKTQALHFAPQQSPITAPHFVMYVKDLLVQQYGEQAVLQGGLEVITSLDPTIHQVAQAAVTDELAKLTRLNVSNGAALVTNPSTGEILGMVGSRDYFDFDHDGQVNVTTRPRQPGSAIKPVNYSVALGSGFTPATIIPDTPICYQIPGQPTYCPKNYDGDFHGLVTLRAALASSYNVPAVKTLSIHGVSKMIDQGRLMGITTWDDPSRFGLSLTLGGGEVTMVDMAVVYGSLANLGLKVDLHPILKVTDHKGKILEEFVCTTPLGEQALLEPGSAQTKSDLAPATFDVVQASTTTTCSAQKVLSPTIAFQLTDILSDNLARAPAFGLFSVLSVPGHEVAVKTGTTQNLRDNWTIGYTSDFVVLTWVGNNDNTPMSYVASGITGASPIWRRITDALLAGQPPHTFSPPEGLVKVNICTLTGQRACEGCPSKEEYFLPGTEPKLACTPESIEALKQQLEESKDRDRILTGASTGN